MEPLTKIGYHEYDDGDEKIAPNQPEPYTMIFFNDIVSCSQNIIKNYYCFRRHNNTYCFYLCQAYSSLSKTIHSR